MSKIHPTAIVDKSAQLSDDILIGAYAIIEAGAQIDSGCEIASHAVITGNTVMGKNNKVFQHAVVGGNPQDKNYDAKKHKAKLIIGNDNIIREFTTIHAGVTTSSHPTIIGNGNFLMTYAHIAHNCLLQNNIVVVNNVQIAGHVEIYDGVVIGACSGIHQFVQIGARAMIAAYSAVLRDVPPAVLAGGQPARAFGLNRIGLKRLGFDSVRINHIKDNFRLLFQRGLTKEEILIELASLNDQDSKDLIEFLNNSKRGIIRVPLRNKNNTEDE